MADGTTIGYAALQLIPSFDGFGQAVDKQLGGKLKIAGKQGGKDLAKGISDGLKSAEDDYTKFSNKAKDALGKVRKEEAALQDLRDKGINSGSRFVAAEERRNKALRDSASATKDAERAQVTFLDAQKRAGDGAADTGGKFNRLSGIASSLGPAMAAAGAAAGAAAIGGIALLAAGAVKATSELYQLGSAFDDISDTLQIKTGASGAGLDAMVESVKTLGKQVPLSLGDLGSIVAETNRNLHLTGPALDDVSKTLANLGRLTGEDVDIRGLGKAFRGFGVDAKDQVPALDSLFAASQKSGITVNDLIATVVKGGPALRQFGLGFGESAALAATFEEAGLDADKAMAGLTKGLAGLAKDGKPAQQGLKDTVAQIKQLLALGNQAGDSQALDLTNKLFGAKGGVQFFEAIKSGALDLDSLAASVDTAGTSINSTADATDDWEQRWQIFKNTTADALQPLATATFDGINGGLAQLADWVTAHQADIINFFVSVGDAAITMAEASIHAFGSIASSIGDIIAPIGDVLGGITRAHAAAQRLLGDSTYADELDRQADGYFSMGESLQHFGDAANNINLEGLRNGLHNAGNEAIAALNPVKSLGENLGSLPTAVAVAVDLKLNAGAGFSIGNAGVTIPVTTSGPLFGTAAAGPSAPTVPGRAGGGMLPGYSTTDNMLVPMAGGEGVIKSSVMRKLGAGWLNAINNGYANGGIVGLAPDVAAAEKLVGTPYSQGSRFDCSGTVARVINDALGLPGGGLMTTKTAQAWLSARGFIQGTGGRGAITVGWYDRGPNPNDGHMAMTLSDGTNAESGGRNSVFTLGAGAKGGADTGFDHHMYLPIASGQGPATGTAADALKKGAAAVTNPDGGIGGQGTPTSGGAGGGGGLSLTSSFSGLAGMGLSGLGAGVGATKSGSDLSVFGDAAAAAVTGQVSSALGVFGVNDSPGWLKGISTLVGGISVGGQGSAGSSAAPVSARSFSGAVTPPPMDGAAHGLRAGQAPGPVYNIRTATVEDAYVQAQRKERERAASKLSRF